MAYAGITFTPLGAAASQLLAGGGPGELVAPLAFVAVRAASRALRPDARRASR